MPELYVIAGTNGVGKTTSFIRLIPKGLEYVNSDLIAKAIREQAGGLNAQDIANREAVDQFNRKISARESFGIETNLYDHETFKSFQAVQALGYTINLFYIGVEDVRVCNQRIENRVKQGGHFVRPEIVEHRFEMGIRLLAYYKDFPDRLIIFDNTEGPWTKELELRRGEIISKGDSIKSWVLPIIDSIQKKAKLKDQDSIEDVRRAYRRKKGL